MRMFMLPECFTSAGLRVSHWLNLFQATASAKVLMREFTVRKLCHCHQHFPFRHSYRSLISVIIHDIKPFLQVHERQLPSMLPLTILASQVTVVLEHF